MSFPHRFLRCLVKVKQSLSRGEAGGTNEKDEESDLVQNLGTRRETYFEQTVSLKPVYEISLHLKPVAQSESALQTVVQRLPAG